MTMPASASRRKPMICSSEKGFLTSNLLIIEDWTPNRFATQFWEDVGPRNSTSSARMRMEGSENPHAPEVYLRPATGRRAQLRTKCSCSLVSNAPGRTRRTSRMTTFPLVTAPLSKRSIQATVPALPRPPLQWTTTLCPSASDFESEGPKVAQARRKSASGTAPSTIGRPYHWRPKSAA